jgi:hypothetical protein
MSSSASVPALSAAAPKKSRAPKAAKAEVAPATVAPVTAVASVTAAAPATPAKASKSTVAAVVAPAKATAAAVVAPVATAAVVAPTNDLVAATAATAAVDINIVSEFATLVETVNTLRSTLSTVFSNMKKLEKQIPRELKKAQKGRRRRAVTLNADGTEAPKKESTVFKKPIEISEALCQFLGVSKGTLLSRSDVTSRVCAYARNNKLMEKQVIKADAPLRKLLALTEADELKILNLQRYLKPHYPKSAVAAPTTTA